MARKQEYNIIFETKPSNTYSKEESIMLIGKATDLLIQELIMKKLNK